MSTTQFRYFLLRYTLWAKKKYPDVYTKITTNQGLRECYTHLVRYAEQTAQEWIDVLRAQNINTTTSHGFDWYWKFQGEIQKQEYKELEKILLVTSVAIAPRAAQLRIARFTAEMPGDFFDLRGRRMSPGPAIPVPALHSR
jgi:hypothetical protein